MKRAVIKKLIEHGCTYDEREGVLTFPVRMLGLWYAEDEGAWYWNVTKITPEEAKDLEEGDYRYKLIYDEPLVMVAETVKRFNIAGAIEDAVQEAKDEVTAEALEAAWRAKRCRG